MTVSTTHGGGHSNTKDEEREPEDWLWGTSIVAQPVVDQKRCDSREHIKCTLAQMRTSNGGHWVEQEM